MKILKQLLFIIFCIVLPFTSCKNLQQLEGEVDVGLTRVSVKFKCSFNDAEQYNTYGCYLNDMRAITYSVLNTPNGVNEKQFREVLTEQMSNIEGVIDSYLVFIPVRDYERPTLRFDSYKNDENRPFHAFDGKGGTLEYTYWNCYYDCEMANNIFFDNSETFTTETCNGDCLSLPSITLHALFHFLGAKHNQDPTSIMYPYFSDRNATMNKDDSLFLKDNYMSY